MLVAHSSIFKTIFQSLSLSMVIMLVSPTSYGQQLPPTNMGQFVHQPGDNQYTNQAQAERHGAPASVMVPVSSTVSAPPATPVYRPTPVEPKPDISLLPVVADEPIKPAGFPPLPDRLDLPTAGAGVWTGANNQTTISANNGVNVNVDNGIPRDPQGVHQHYVHYQAGAFMPNQTIQQTQQSTYKPSSADYYNINPNAKAGMAHPIGDLETPSMKALKNMGSEPQLAQDKVSKPDAPTAVTVNQSVSQDLSLPEDDFNQHYPTNINNTTANRTGNGMARMLVYPLRSVGYAAAGMATYGAMYAIRR